jgi:hypothetical protein
MASCSRMARVLIVGGSERGRRLGRALLGRGFAVRAVAHSEHEAALMREAGIEPWPGSARRLGSLQGALAHVTVACWLFGDRAGDDQELPGEECAAAHARALHGELLASFMRQLVDSPARGLAYELPGLLPEEVPGAGRRLASELAARHALALALIAGDPADPERWLQGAITAIERLVSSAPLCFPRSTQNPIEFPYK